MKDWISVEDRLPQKSGKYMVRAIWGSVDREIREEPALFQMYSHGKYGRFQYGFDWCTITHWKEIR